MKKALACFGFVVAFGATLLSFVGVGHVMVFGVPVGLAVFFLLGYAFYRNNQ
jgi:hypothetical protein